MTEYSRRRVLSLPGAALGTGLLTLPACQERPNPRHAASDGWGRGFENQRIADRGDGTFLNPIFAGDHPDPSIIKSGDTYYLTFSSFDAYPGLMIWSSQDLVNWQPVGPALTQPIGSVWAPDLVEHDGRFYIYIPARTDTYKSIYVIHADHIEGPWSDPIDLGLPDHIDPGHIVGEDDRRYLFLSSGDRVALADNGLSLSGDVEHVYDPWMYPDDWDVECFCPEGPKMLRRGDWFYMLTAVGGTAGPPTGHMVIAARSRSIHGPWEHAPNNPQVRTRSRREAWWSRGHATLIQGPNDDWWLIYHGYERDFWTLGRQCLLEPVAWRGDDWFETVGGDLSTPLPKPSRSETQPHGWPYSDQFPGDQLSPKWTFHKPAPSEYDRVSIADGGLSLSAKGEMPADASPLCVNVGDRRYVCEVDIVRQPGCRAGLLLFYNERMYCGLGVDDDGLIMHRYGTERRRSDPFREARAFSLRVTNDAHVVTFHTRLPGADWTKFDVQMEVSGYHHNTAYGFLSLRPALYAAGQASATFRRFEYRALSGPGTAI